MVQQLLAVPGLAMQRWSPLQRVSPISTMITSRRCARFALCGLQFAGRAVLRSEPSGCCHGWAGRSHAFVQHPRSAWLHAVHILSDAGSIVARCALTSSCAVPKNAIVGARNDGIANGARTHVFQFLCSCVLLSVGSRTDARLPLRPATQLTIAPDTEVRARRPRRHALVCCLLLTSAGL